MTRQFIDSFPGQDLPLVWFDFSAYTQKLFLKDQPIPWLSPSEFEPYYRQAIGLLNPSVAVLDLDAMISAYQTQTPSLRKSMTFRARTSFALKTLLADSGLRTAVSKLCAVTAHARGRRPMCLRVSAPLRMMRAAYRFAHGADMSHIGEDDAERAAVYLTDFLGALAQAPGTIILLVDEDGEASQPTYHHVLSPLSNLSRHLRFKLAMATCVELTDPMQTDILFTPLNFEGMWAKSVFDVSGSFNALYTTIPKNTEPELVLQTLMRLRVSR